MRKPGLILALSISIFSFISCKHEQLPGQSLSSDVLEKLDNVENAMFEATFNGDSAAFHKICGSDYFTINANGESGSLETALQGVAFFKGATCTFSEQQQRVYGDLVLRTGRAQFSMGGKPVAEILYTSGWVYRDGRWQFIHWQGTLSGMSLYPLREKAMIEPHIQH